MKVFAVLYNECIYEGGYSTISLHYTEEGAKKALAFDKYQRMLDFCKEGETPSEKDIPSYERWNILEMEIKD